VHGVQIQASVIIPQLVHSLEPYIEEHPVGTGFNDILRYDDFILVVFSKSAYIPHSGAASLGGRVKDALVE
jgi:hypothetical protein